MLYAELGVYMGLWLWESVHWAWYAVAMAFFAGEFIYGMLLASTGDAGEKARGYRLMGRAVEALVYGIAVAAVAAVLWAMAAPRGGEGIPSLLEYAAQRYDNATAHVRDYVLALGWFGAQLYLTPLTSWLGNVWMAESWLANYSAQALLAVLAAYSALSRILASYGLELVSLGIALVGAGRLRGAGGALVASTLVLSAYLGYAATSLLDPVFTAKLDAVSVPVVGPTAEIVTGRAAEVLEHGRTFTQVLVNLSFTLSLALILAAGFSVAVGGLARSLSARV
ncbi:MAG: hypothetical protein DRK00_06515 [Thermoprotei archaeon]|nr:MAG: hypothetical protein DRK00_06515 [Thermoprotei archaeon]